jgi:hypothetical protein
VHGPNHEALRTLAVLSADRELRDLQARHGARLSLSTNLH